MRVLIVEDDPSIRKILQLSLTKKGYEVDIASNVSTATVLLETNAPDLVLLDWMLPDISGVEFLRKIRQIEHFKDLPVVMLTAKATESDKVLAFESGADDYIVKPFSFKELHVRLQAILRRAKVSNFEEKYSFGDLQLITSSQQVTILGEVMKLGPTEYKLLVYFMQNHGNVLSRNKLIDNVWGVSSYVEERAVDVSIRRLRKAFEKTSCKNYITTVYGSGYRFQVNNNNE